MKERESMRGWVRECGWEKESEEWDVGIDVGCIKPLIADVHRSNASLKRSVGFSSLIFSSITTFIVKVVKPDEVKEYYS